MTEIIDYADLVHVCPDEAKCTVDEATGQGECKLDPPPPGTDAWHEIVTASKVAGIMGLSPWESPMSLWHKMKGTVTREDDINIGAKERGNYLEGGILRWWVDKRPEYDRVVAQWYSEKDGWAGATLDGLATGPDVPTAIVEVKTSSSSDSWGKQGTDQIPDHYLAQVDWQFLMVPDAKVAYVAALLGPRMLFHEYVVQRDDERIARLEWAATVFRWSLSAEEPPPLDDTVATHTTLKALHPLIEKDEDVEVDRDFARRFLGAVADAKAADSAERSARSAMLAEMTHARRALCDGKVVARRQGNKSGVSLVSVGKLENYVDSGVSDSVS